VICSGAADGVLARVLAGEPAGTLFTARGGRYSSFKLWLRYTKPSRGTLAVDAGAARALREGGTSLLPVGIVEVRGEFSEGDAVEVVHGPALIGKGIVNYSSADLGRAAGRQTAEIREILPQASVEAVHRDYFVLA
jgi:glutamate 5-kinase